MSSKTKAKNEISILFNTLDHLDEQGKVLRQTLEIALATRDEVSEMGQSIRKDIDELRDSITLNRHEQREIQVAVSSKSWKLTAELFKCKVSDDLFLAKVAHFRTAIYNRLKDTFDITRYFDIRRVDFIKALKVIEAVELTNLKKYQVRMTDKQKQIAERNKDDVSYLK